MSKVCAPKPYTKIGFLGKGAYAKVLKARLNGSDKIVAIKKVRLDQSNFQQTDGQPDGISISTLREIRFLRFISHPYILKLNDVFITDRNISLVIDYMDGDLRNIIHNRNIVLNQSHIKSYMIMIVQAMSYLHKNWVIHRDLKPENILISPDGTIRIADFGLARIYGYSNAPMTPTVITRWYRPPELFFGANSYDASVDVWSIGCIFAELLLKKPLFAGENDIDQLNKIFTLLGSPNVNNWQTAKTLPSYIEFVEMRPIHLSNILTAATTECISLIYQMLQVNPMKRILSSNIFKSKYFIESPSATDFDQLPKIKRELTRQTDYSISSSSNDIELAEEF